MAHPRRYRRFHRIYKKIRIVVYLAFSLFAVFHLFPQGMRDLQLYIQEQDYKQQLQDLEAETASLQAQLDETDSPEWIEKIAREQLGLVKQGETIEVTN